MMSGKRINKNRGQLLSCLLFCLTSVLLSISVLVFDLQAEEKEKNFLRYQVNAKLMKAAKKDAIALHCLPAKRGKEITDEVMDGPQSAIFDESENRLHAHKAIMALTM